GVHRPAARDGGSELPRRGDAAAARAVPAAAAAASGGAVRGPDDLPQRADRPARVPGPAVLAADAVLAERLVERRLPVGPLDSAADDPRTRAVGPRRRG